MPVFGLVCCIFLCTLFQNIVSNFLRIHRFYFSEFYLCLGVTNHDLRQQFFITVCQSLKVNILVSFCTFVPYIFVYSFTHSLKDNFLCEGIL
jgi:hypothetical protein